MIPRALVSTVSAFAILSTALPAAAGTKYSYDSAGRLIQVEYSSGVTIRYSYDAVGNRRTITTAQLPNRLPVAANDSASVVAGGTVDIQARANDSDPDRNSLTISAVSAVSGGGTATIMGGGTHIRYTAPGTAGVKTFTYTISDSNGGTASATVTVTVGQPPNRVPTAAPDTATVAVSSAIDIQVRANDSDPDGDPLTITAVSAVTGGGTAAIMGGGTHLRFTAPTTTGVKSFTYTISDGRGGTATAAVNVTVTPPPNRAPVANPDNGSVYSGSTVAIMALANDTDPDGDALTITSVSNPSMGTASVGPGGGYILYNAPTSPGQVTFNYTISDGRGGTASSNITVDLLWVNPCVPPPGKDYCEQSRSPAP
ncbi:RHS Repeat protein [compost metagenome]